MATNTQPKRKSQQRQAAFRLLILVAILVCINMLAARFHYGLDLTREKRFTLSTATKNLLRNMDDVAVVNVYLKGNFPAGFQRLSEATRERLQSFREYAGSKIVFRFIDPFEGKSEMEKKAIYQQLVTKGIMPVELNVKDAEDGSSQKVIFPYALVQYNNREMAVRLLDNKIGLTPLEILNYSESMLEYKFAGAINKLSSPAKPEIAYIMGHGEALGAHTYDLLTTLAGIYTVDTIDLVNSLYISPVYKAVIINKPTQRIDDRDKFKIDQYVMNGGRVLWAVESLNATMDSMQFHKGGDVKSPEFLAMDYGLNLDDQLFKYGVRVNPTLVEDMQCLEIPVTVGVVNNNPQIELRPWIYFPLFTPESRHPIVNNMGEVFGRFVSTIDTIANPEIKKTILLTSSKYSRVSQAPARVSLAMVQFAPRPEMFKQPSQPVAVLLEGKFKSVFQNQLTPQFLQILRDSIKRPFKPEADSASKMIVIADGDMLLNDFTESMGPMEMGYWRFTKSLYSNKAFILNCLEYLTDNAGLLEARSKDTRLRLLDGGRVRDEKNTWQALNIGLPIALVLIFASAYLFFRKRRYEKKA
ncbi:gliding motility-associated ABC transporter substrate-binding protein GldG [Polluticoccus soli]|uniref:gliding motility-associated ABC transporter substrate-binding protein GldG n=1 Tax=Polluticoccus soli TaxID=3034150 RepID=UPI0023E31556|nr:gliding motility-associated ABC transporter substrate-binding protein GldG [Flavipsychrobacter sp. JY13-12]